MVLQNSKIYEDNEQANKRSFPPFKIAIHDPLSIGKALKCNITTGPLILSNPYNPINPNCQKHSITIGKLFSID